MTGRGDAEKPRNSAIGTGVGIQYSIAFSKAGKREALANPAGQFGRYTVQTHDWQHRRLESVNH